MDFLKLRTFSVLAYYKNFSKAADALFVSQPNVTKQIKRLEEELGVQLIQRDKQYFSLTDEGVLFLEFCQQALQLQSHYEQKRKALHVDPNKLNIGTTNLIANAILPEILLDFSKKYPSLKLNLKVDHSKHIINYFEQAEISVALLSSYIPLEIEGLDMTFVLRDPLVVIVPVNHRLCGQTTCQLSDLEDECFITKDTSSSLYQYLQTQLNHPVFMEKNYVGIGTQSSIKRAVSKGLGFSIVSAHLIQNDVALNKLHALTIENYPLERSVYAYHHPQFIKHPMSVQFMQYLKDLNSD